MTTVLSQKGQLVLPVPVRQQFGLEPGDDFEVAIEDEDTITLRRVSHPANRGLVDLTVAESSDTKVDETLPLMNTASRPGAFVCAFFFALVSPVFGQGNLTPPGPPAPTMKTLDQVEARTIINAANTPGDANNTFIISQAGSYYLTGNITGESGKNGISIQAEDVTLDLNGFALISGGGASARGVNVPTAKTSFCIRNGSVRGWSGGGVRADAATGLAEKLRVTNNLSGIGLAMGNGSIIRDCESSGNGTGFYAPERTQVSNCISTINTGIGISGTDYVTVIDCTVSRNGGVGIQLGGFDTVTRCTVSRNDGGGIAESGGSHIADCTVGNNSVNGISVGIGSTVQNCTARSNVASGIIAMNSCYLIENKCSGNSTGISITAPGGQGGMENRIDGNSCTDNGVGISVFGLLNLTIRNYASGNSSGNYSISGPSLNKTGPIVTSGGTISSTSPWANFE